ncbi:aminopeptidase P N-terminal domain-containing protein [bacterium]|nr:aminopeptidase P N-terminal domain-containing protein [bacterium]
MFKKEIYCNRRNQLKSLLQSGVILLIGNKEVPFNGPDNPYPFRQDSTFLYYAGIDRPGLALVIDLDTGEEILFGEEKTEEQVIWSGNSLSIGELADRSGIKQSKSYSDLAGIVQKMEKSNRKCHLLAPYQAEVKLELMHLFDFKPDQISGKVSMELTKAVIQQRLIKDEFEIREMESAANIAHKMHTTAMIMAMPGAVERDIKGVIEGIASSMGGTVSFQPIVSIRGEILHNNRCLNTLEKGKMLVIDAGAESAMHYASDITRSIPVGRSFSRMQKNIYEIVLKANQQAIEQAGPGVSFLNLHQMASLTICRGLKELGLMKGNEQEAVAAGAHALFFPHGLGHLLGLDIHDMDALGEDLVGYGEEQPRSEQFGLKNLRLARKLRPGFTVTIEPGIYFIPSLIDSWKKEKRFDSFINYEQVVHYEGLGGIRIEDNILITENGSRTLGKPIPKTINEIESY